MNRSSLRAVAAPLTLVAALAGCSLFRPALPAAQCHAAGASSVLGKEATDLQVSEALRLSGALRSRLLPYGAMVSGGDVDAQRLNIETDGQRVIQRMRCG